MKFNIGDTVRVTTDRFGPRQIGNIGIITQTDRPSPINLNIRVSFDGFHNAYCEDDLELYLPPPLLQPEFNLDEIVMAQEIMDQMG